MDTKYIKSKFLSNEYYSYKSHENYVIKVFIITKWTKWMVELNLCKGTQHYRFFNVIKLNVY